MRCNSFTPVYYHARDRNVRGSGYSWHLYDGNGEERGCNSSMLWCDLSAYDKEVLKQIIQNHEATFRYQVQELHRLYRRQRDLMDETMKREIFAHHLLSRTSESSHFLSHAGAEFSQNCSLATSWLFSNLASTKLSERTSGNVEGHKTVAEKLGGPATLKTDCFMRKNSVNGFQFLSPCYKQCGNEIVNLELAADVHYDDQRKQFKVENFSEAPELKRRAPEEISNFQPASDPGSASINTLGFSSSSSYTRKTNCFIDLNEPIQLESLPASSSSLLEAFTGHNKTFCSDKCVLVEAKRESIVPTQSQLLKSDGSSSGGANSSMAIDLNSMPVNCFSEMEMTLESPRSMNRNAKVLLDCSFLKTECINLNSCGSDVHCLLRSSSTLQIKSAEDTELKGPVSPENEESSPPRGTSEDTHLETHLSSEQGVGEPFTEVDALAAETLVNMGAAVFDPVTKFRILCWFAEFVSSSGDNQVEENDLNLLHLNKAKGTGSMSSGPGKGQKKGKKGRQIEEVLGSQGCPKPGQLKRKAGKNGCAKPRKCSKLSSSSDATKSMSFILKQSAARMDQGVLQRWGQIRKRQGGCRRRASNSFSLASF